jgi:hypothetical protein
MIFEQTGWEIADRGDESVLVGDASNLSLSILAYEGKAIGADDPEFMLYDRERDLAYWVRVVPTPTTAAVLLEAHGDRPEEEPGRAR